MITIQGICRLEGEHYMMIPVSMDKAFEKSQRSLMVKMLSKLGIEGKFLNLSVLVC